MKFTASNGNNYDNNYKYHPYLLPSTKKAVDRYNELRKNYNEQINEQNEVIKTMAETIFDLHEQNAKKSEQLLIRFNAITDLVKLVKDDQAKYSQALSIVEQMLKNE